MIITSPTDAGDLWRLSATELAAAIRHRQVSAGEVVDAHLRRIDAVNSAVNAIVIRLDEQALDAAHEADRTAVGGTELPPFHGVPFTVKGNIDVVGTPTTQGAWALAGAYPTRDAPAVERLRAAGAIPIGSDLDDGAVARTVRGMRMATAINALGLPAVAVPVGIADGLPQVVQESGPAIARTSVSMAPWRSKTGSAPSRPSTRGNPCRGGRPDHR